MEKLIVFIFCFLLIIVSCYIDVPHSNPNDTDNPFGMGSINVIVMSFDSVPINNAHVIINNDTMLTNDNGEINYSTYIDTVKIIIKKDGYSCFQIDTILNIGDIIKIDAFLNYIPFIINANIFTERSIVEDIFDSNYYAINYYLTIKDIDGIENIYKTYINVYDTIFNLNYYKDSADCIIYKLKLEKNDYNNFFNLIGQNTKFIIIDNMHFADSVDNIFAKRFIEELPTINKPSEGEMLLLPDTFYWDLTTPLYSAYQVLYIVSDENDTIIKLKEDINIRKKYIDTILESKEYNFIIRIFDEFGNYSQSNNFFSVL